MMVGMATAIVVIIVTLINNGENILARDFEMENEWHFGQLFGPLLQLIIHWRSSSLAIVSDASNLQK